MILFFNGVLCTTTDIFCFVSTISSIVLLSQNLHILISVMFLKKLLTGFFGILVGIINGTVGAGGGLVAVPLLKSSGISQKESHSSAIAVLLPVCVTSALSYLYAGHVELSDATPYFIPSIIGAVVGTFLLDRISTELLKKVFALFMLYAGVRLFLR